MKIEVLWELLSAKAPPARCTHQYDPDTEHLIVVIVGETLVIKEDVASEIDAVDEAGHLLAHYMLQGWTELMYRDPRIALPQRGHH